jgi:crotonobetainyl-CoA:carnitine CoA-transferase CaiB-like acyl-CoA transferase
VGVPWVDLGIATTAAFLIASHWRAGRPIHLDLAMLDVATAWATIKPSAVVQREPTYGTFASADGVTFVLALLEDDMWQRLCGALGLEEWSADHALAHYRARVEQADVVRKRVAGALGARSATELDALAHQADLPLDRVLAPDESAASEQVLWRRRESRQDGVVPIGAEEGVELSALVER